jgi:hypothetical protein
MLYGLCLLLLTYSIATSTVPASAMADQQQDHVQLESYNTQASLLYEQAFFLELLLSIMASRRYDEFNADVALARSKIMAHVESSIEHHELPFDDDIPPHEIFSLSNIYYVCMYLINQNTFNKLCNELPLVTQNHELKLLAHMLTLLLAFIEHHKTSLRCSLSYLNSQTQNFIQLTLRYQRECALLRASYTEYIRILREKAIFYEDIKQYIFHKYLRPKQKLLPLLLDSGIEPILYAPITTVAAIPVYEYSQTTDLPQPSKKRKSESSTPDIPVMQFIPCIPHFLRNYYDIFAAYDYQEYIASRISHVIEKPDEMPLFLQDFFTSYYKNHDTLQYVFARTRQEPEIFITDSLVPLQKACNILHHIQEEPTSIQRCFKDLKIILEESYQGRITS